MFVRKLVNITETELEVELSNGAVVILPPKAKLECCQIANINSLLGKVQLIEDLTEVDRNYGSKRLWD